MRNLIYEFKILINEKAMIFWTILFPIILATFFNMAFSNIYTQDKFDAVKVAIVKNVENNEFEEFISGLSKENENQLLSIKYTNENEAKQLLKDEKISGYLIVNDEIEVIVDSNGINQTILKSIIDKYYQVGNFIKSIYENNPKANIEEILTTLEFDRDNFKEVQNNNVDLSVIYFYTLIGMTCLYGSFFGLKVATINEANLSKQGARINISPVSKLKKLLAGMTMAFIVQYINMLILFAYLNFVLKISFGDQTVYILILMAVGSFVGVSLGNLVGNALKMSENSKITVLVVISMFLSFLSGMMNVDIKYLVQENVPILSYINPINLITDGLYGLYYYSDNERYLMNLINLIVVGIIIALVSFIFMRRKKYDSI